MSGGGTNCCDTGSGVCYATTNPTCPTADTACWAADTGSATSKAVCEDSCCVQAHPTGAQDFGSYLRACACNATSGPCTSTCANEFCAGGKFTSPGDACAQCIAAAVGASGACAASVQSQCSANADCSAYATCADGCP